MSETPLSEQKLRASGDVTTTDLEKLAQVLRPVLTRWFAGDDSLSIRIKDTWNELRIDATGFDLYFNGPGRGDPANYCWFASSFRGPRDAARKLYQQLSDALLAGGIHHEFTLSYDDENGEFIEEEPISR